MWIILLKVPNKLQLPKSTSFKHMYILTTTSSVSTTRSFKIIIYCKTLQKILIFYNDCIWFDKITKDTLICIKKVLYARDMFLKSQYGLKISKSVCEVMYACEIWPKT